MEFIVKNIPRRLGLKQKQKAGFLSNVRTEIMVLSFDKYDFRFWNIGSSVNI